MRINKERMLDEFVAMVSIDSPSLCEKQMGKYIKEQLYSLDFSVSEDDAGKQLDGNCGQSIRLFAGRYRGGTAAVLRTYGYGGAIYRQKGGDR